MNAKKTFEDINQIDEKIEYKAVKNKRVQERHDRASLEYGLLAENDPHRPPNPPGKVVEARVGSTAKDGTIHRVKFRAAVVERPERKQDKNDFLDQGQHSGPINLRLLFLSAWRRACQNQIRASARR